MKGTNKAASGRLIAWGLAVTAAGLYYNTAGRIADRVRAQAVWKERARVAEDVCRVLQSHVSPGTAGGRVLVDTNIKAEMVRFGTNICVAEPDTDRPPGVSAVEFWRQKLSEWRPAYAVFISDLSVDSFPAAQFLRSRTRLIGFVPSRDERAYPDSGYLGAPDGAVWRGGFYVYTFCEAEP